jgi:hypothetical protein
MLVKGQVRMLRRKITDDLAARGFCSRIRPGRSTRQCLRLIRLSLQTGLV